MPGDLLLKPARLAAAQIAVRDPLTAAAKARHPPPSAPSAGLIGAVAWCGAELRRRGGGRCAEPDRPERTTQMTHRRRADGS